MHISLLSSSPCESTVPHAVVRAYLVRTAYKMTMMGFDNTWMQAQDRAKKAGRLLGEVLEKKVQGERPVVFVGLTARYRTSRQRTNERMQIGTSLGAYTIMEALLYLSSRPAPSGARDATPSLVESAILISLPSAPTADEWMRARSVVARRFVNAYSEQDLVLGIVARCVISTLDRVN